MTTDTTAARDQRAREVDAVIAALSPAWFPTDYNHRQACHAVRKVMLAFADEAASQPVGRGEDAVESVLHRFFPRADAQTVIATAKAILAALPSSPAIQPVEGLTSDNLDHEKAYFERGMFAAYAWMLTRRKEQDLSDAVVEHAWENRDEGMEPTECLPKRPVLVAVDHPFDSASLREVFDYAARRLADGAGDSREYRSAIDRFDEAYMWLVAAQQESSHD